MQKVLFVYLYFDVRLHFFPTRGFDNDLRLLVATLGKESILGEVTVYGAGGGWGWRCSRRLKPPTLEPNTCASP